MFLKYSHFEYCKLIHFFVYIFLNITTVFSTYLLYLIVTLLICIAIFTFYLFMYENI